MHASFGSRDDVWRPRLSTDGPRRQRRHRILLPLPLNLYPSKDCQARCLPKSLPEAVAVYEDYHEHYVSADWKRFLQLSITPCCWCARGGIVRNTCALP